MKVAIFFHDSDHYMVPATTQEIATGDYYEVPEDLYNEYTTAEEAWDQAQADLAVWVREHPNKAQEPELPEGGIEPIYTNEFEG